MLTVIEGKQRAGKTCFCVSQIIDYLKHTNRHIYVNLPVNIDYLCEFASGGKIKRKALYESYLSRIHVFKSFHGFNELIHFYNNCREWFNFHRRAGDLKRFFMSADKIIHFWHHTEPNSLVFFDEVYQWFSSSNYNNKTLVEQRKELLTYCRQHGHYKDDIILISHDKLDIDVFIRRGIQYLYMIRNSKYTNIIEPEFKLIFHWGRLFRGLKYPVQFFFIDGFEYGEELPSDSWTMYPDKRLFKCYDSFSAAESLNRATASNEQQSTDTGLNFWYNFRRFLNQFWFPAASLIIGCFVVYYFFMGLIDNLGSDPDKKFSVASGKDIHSTSNILKSKVKENVKSEKVVSVVCCLPDRIVLSNGKTYFSGQKYDNYSIDGFNGGYVYVTTVNGERYRITFQDFATSSQVIQKSKAI